jgi:hypothetical protein
MKAEENYTGTEIGDNTYHISNNNGYDYFLILGTTGCSFRFGKVRTELKIPKVHGIYNSDLGGLYVLARNGAIEKTTYIPVEFVYAKYYQIQDFFSLIVPFHEKICTGRLAAEEPNLASQIDFYAIRLINELLDDLANDQHIAETIGKKLNLRIQNALGNETSTVRKNGRQPGLPKRHGRYENDDWMSLEFNGGSYYYLDPKTLRDDDKLYYLGVNKEYNQVVFAKGRPAEYKNTIYELNISQDDGLGRYTVQAGNDVITQFIVPTEFISNIYNNSRLYISDFNTGCSDTSLNIFDKQMKLNHVHDNVIYLIERTLNYIDKVLKQKIDKSLNYKSILVPDKITSMTSISRLYEVHNIDEARGI